jgi:hypothetical protein
MATITESNLKIGAVLKMPLAEDDGITPKNEEKRLKFFIIVGFTATGDIIGVVIVNKNINKYYYTHELYQHHYPLEVTKYRGVFTRNCFANCTEIKPLPRQRVLNEATYIGKIHDDDFELIYELLANSDIITQKNKKEYGIIPAEKET